MGQSIVRSIWFFFLIVLIRKHKENLMMTAILI